MQLLNGFLSADLSAKTGFVDGLNSFVGLMKKACNDSNNNCEITPQLIASESNIITSNSVHLDQHLLANNSSFDSIVDYQNKYYFNTTVPPFGITTASMELAADGTISKASSTVDSTKLADLVPLKELLIDKWGIEKIASGAALATVPRDYSWALSINTNGFKYTLEKTHPINSGLNLLPLNFNTSGISISREEFSKSNSAQKKANKNAISIQGTIILPEK